MTFEQALAELSPGHAVAIRLRDQGADQNTIAAALGIPHEAVSAFLEIAQSKLDALVDTRPGDV